MGLVVCALGGCVIPFLPFLFLFPFYFMRFW